MLPLQQPLERRGATCTYIRVERCKNNLTPSSKCGPPSEKHGKRHIRSPFRGRGAAPRRGNGNGIPDRKREQKKGITTASMTPLTLLLSVCPLPLSLSLSLSLPSRSFHGTFDKSAFPFRRTSYTFALFICIAESDADADVGTTIGCTRRMMNKNL